MARYNEHLTSKNPTVLCMSGGWEGIDLKGDYSRWQCIPALPRPFWAGQIAARAKISPRWYRHQTMTKLIQGCGRSVRSETDFSATYVLDRALREELDRKGSMIPKWFAEACIRVD